MKDLAGRLERMKQELNGFPQWADVMLGLHAFAMIKDRIVNTGIAADGQSYKPYSTKPTLIGASSFRTKGNADKVFSSKKKRQALEWRTVNTNKGPRHLAILQGGYKQIRILDEQQADHKDFTRTAQMWLSIHVKGTKQVGQGKYITTIGTDNELSNKKLEGNEKREGKAILACNQKEEKELEARFDKYITEIVNRAING